MPIKKKFSKLIVKDGSGNLVQLLPETKVDTELDFTSDFPIANSAVASVLNSIEIPDYQEVTQQENGLMTSYDKIKLDNSVPIYKDDAYWLQADPYSSPTKAYFQSFYNATDDDIQNDKLSHIEYIIVGRTSGDITDNLPLYITITSSENSAEIPIYASYNDWYSHTICTVGKFYKLLNASGGRIPIYIKNSTTSYLLTEDTYQGATTNAQGVPGLVPSAAITELNSFLKGDGTWSETNILSDTFIAYDCNAYVSNYNSTNIADIVNISDYRNGVAYEVNDNIGNNDIIKIGESNRIGPIFKVRTGINNYINDYTLRTLVFSFETYISNSEKYYICLLDVSNMGNTVGSEVTQSNVTLYESDDNNESYIASTDFSVDLNFYLTSQDEYSLNFTINKLSNINIQTSIEDIINEYYYNFESISNSLPNSYVTSNGDHREYQNINGVKVFINNIFGNAKSVLGSEINVSESSCFSKTITSNTTFTFTFTGVPSNRTATFTLILTNGGAYTVTFPNNVVWNTTQPELQASGTDILTFFTPDGGTTWYNTDVTISEYQGATSSANGVSGLVPAALSADRDKFLKGDGTWGTVSQYAQGTASDLSTGTNETYKVWQAKVIAEYVSGKVDSKLAENDAMIYKGTVSGTAGLPATHNAGWTYKATSAFTLATGKVVEIGDMVICNTDGTTANASHWDIIQGNIDGAVIGPASSVTDDIALFADASGKVIKDGGKKLSDFATTGHTHSQYLTAHQSLANYATVGHTHSQYLTAHQSLANYATTGHTHSEYLTAHQSIPSLSVSTTGSGTVVNEITVSNHAITVNKGITPITAVSATNTGTGNAVTSISASGNTVTATKGTSFVDLSSSQTITGVKTFDVSVFSNTVALSGTQINVPDGPVFTKTITANTSFTITGVPTGKSAMFTLILTNAGAYTVTFPNSVEWNTNVNFKTSGTDIVTFFTPDGGTHWYAYAEVTVYTGATTSANGIAGLVPPAISSEKDKFLKGDGTWDAINISNMVTTDTNQSITGIKTFDKNTFTTPVALSSGAIDVTLSSVFTKTITANTTFTFTNTPSGKSTVITLVLTNAGAYDLTFPNSVVWASGTQPDFNDNGVDIITFFTYDGGTHWYDQGSILTQLKSIEDRLTEIETRYISYE